MFDEYLPGRTVIADDSEAIGEMSTLYDEHLRGRTVIAADGQTIGEMAALFVDTSKWMILALQIKLTKSAAEQPGAAKSLLRAATLDLPVRLI